MSNLFQTRSAIGAATKSRIHRVDMPEIDGAFLIKSLSWKDANAMGRAIREADDQEKEVIIDREFRHACALCLVDEQGERIFGDDGMDDIAAMDWAIVNKLVVEIQKFSGLGVEAAEIGKNSEPSSIAASPSA